MVKAAEPDTSENEHPSVGRMGRRKRGLGLWLKRPKGKTKNRAQLAKVNAAAPARAVRLEIIEEEPEESEEAAAERDYSGGCSQNNRGICNSEASG